MREAFDRGRDGRSTDLPSGAGVPSWIAQNLNFCSSCGGPLRFGSVPGEDRERLACAACGHIAYVNPRLVVTTLPITDAGEIVLIRRGIEPGLGSWAQPGGFLEIDETVNQAAIRETFEETGLLVEPGEIVGLYTRLEAIVVTIAFEARITGGRPPPHPRRPRWSRSPPTRSRGERSRSRPRSGRSATGSICDTRSCAPVAVAGSSCADRSGC